MHTCDLTLAVILKVSSLTDGARWPAADRIATELLRHFARDGEGNQPRQFCSQSHYGLHHTDSQVKPTAWTE